MSASDSSTAQLGTESQQSIVLVDLSAQPEQSSWYKWRLWRGRLTRVASPVVILFAWQLLSGLRIVSPQVLPSPTDILAAFVELIRLGDLQAALPISLFRSLTGLAIGGTVGLGLGLFAGLWRIGEEIFDAPLQMLRTIPFIALVPLFIMWFGIDETAKIVVIAAATIFPIYLNTYAGVRGTDPKLLEAATVFGLSHQATVRHVILPMALPSILIGLRFSAGVSLLALVVAEQINAQSGIGYILNSANANQRFDIVIAGIIVYAVLGISNDVVMRLIEHLALPWRPNIVLG